MQKSYKWKVVTAFAVATLVLAGCSSSSDTASEETATDTASEEAAPASTGPLKIGSLLPETGNLAFLGPPEFAGVDLAVQEINDAGGVLGQPVEHIRGDSGDTSTDIAQQTADSHIAAGVGAIVGAASPVYRSPLSTRSLVPESFTSHQRTPHQISPPMQITVSISVLLHQIPSRVQFLAN